MEERAPLTGLSLEDLQQAAKGAGLPSFVGKQLADWIYKKNVKDFDRMTNLSKKTRERLRTDYVIGKTAPVDAQRSVDGTAKYLFQTASGHYIETVYIPDGKRATLCVSCQVGCKMGCAFCMTGRQGFIASLTATDIINQILSIPEAASLTNIVFMGQGEPFDNIGEVLKSINILTAEWGLGWSPKRITVSSVGLAKGLPRFLKECNCHLAISLHHPIPEERKMLMPAERAFGIVEVVGLLKRSGLFSKGRDFLNERTSGQRRLSFEYIVFDGINDSIEHAKAIINLLQGLECRINLIRFHHIPDTNLRGVCEERMIRLRDYLTAHGVFTTIRASRGQDIFAACGLLSTARQERENIKNHE